MSTKALKSQLLAAVAMVLVSSIALGSSTYAWFAINTKVTATGMAVKTQVANNLFIAPDTADSAAKVAEANFKTALVQELDALLEPVSTIDGAAFYYNSTSNTAADGNALAETYVAYNANDPSEFNTNYQTTGAVGYVDYAFRLKAVNTSADPQKVVLKGLNLVYGTTDTETGYKAFRTAMFVQDLGAGTQGDGAAVAAGQMAGVYAPEGFEYQDTGKAVASTTATDNYTYVVNNSGKSVIGTVGAGTTHYYKVVIRLWLEGEDKKCTSTTFAALTDKWAMDVAIELQADEAGAVAALTVATTAAKADLSSASAAGDATITINGVSYYKIDTVTLGGNDLYTTAGGALTAASKVYTLANGQYPIEVTNQCTLPTP